MQLEDYFDRHSRDDIRVKGHRIGIENILDLYLEGYTAEEIVTYYGTLRPVDVYATLTYYHQNRAEIDAYLARVASWREQHEQEMADQDAPPVVQRLRAVKAQQDKERGVA